MLTLPEEDWGRLYRAIGEEYGVELEPPPPLDVDEETTDL